MSEMIRDGHNGLLFEVANTDSLRSAIERFNAAISDKQYTMYANARNIYLEKYHPDKCYDAIMKLYSAVSSLKKTAAWT
ncbi:MAG: hypothetical protein EOO89_31405 [Pedobacter sp.]|nr:MAG: hypothetical protein EOO89_31405 [Pedobacter sp.]